jgi:hypothetical protein
MVSQDTRHMLAAYRVQSFKSHFSFIIDTHDNESASPFDTKPHSLPVANPDPSHFAVPASEEPDCEYEEDHCSDQLDSGPNSSVHGSLSIRMVVIDGPLVG